VRFLDCALYEIVSEFIDCLTVVIAANVAIYKQTGEIEIEFPKVYPILEIRRINRDAPNPFEAPLFCVTMWIIST